MIYRLMTARLIAAPSEVLFDINEGRFKRPLLHLYYASLQITHQKKQVWNTFIYISIHSHFLETP